MPAGSTSPTSTSISQPLMWVSEDCRQQRCRIGSRTRSCVTARSTEYRSPRVALGDRFYLQLPPTYRSSWRRRPRPCSSGAGSPNTVSPGATSRTGSTHCKGVAMRKALVVGIDYYEHIGRLNGCVNDAHAVKAMLDRHSDGSVNFGTRLIV